MMHGELQTKIVEKGDWNVKRKYQVLEGNIGIKLSK